MGPTLLYLGELKSFLTCIDWTIPIWVGWNLFSMARLNPSIPGWAGPLNTWMGWTPQYLDSLDPSIPGWAGPLNTWMGWTPHFLPRWAGPPNTWMCWTPQYLDGLYPSIPGWAVPLNIWMGWTPQYLDGLYPSIPGWAGPCWRRDSKGWSPAERWTACAAPPSSLSSSGSRSGGWCNSNKKYWLWLFSVQLR